MASHSTAFVVHSPAGNPRNFLWNPLSIDSGMKVRGRKEIAQEGLGEGPLAARGNDGFSAGITVARGKGSLPLGVLWKSSTAACIHQVSKTPFGLGANLAARFPQVRRPCPMSGMSMATQLTLGLVAPSCRDLPFQSALHTLFLKSI